MKNFYVFSIVVMNVYSGKQVYTGLDISMAYYDTLSKQFSEAVQFKPRDKATLLFTSSELKRLFGFPQEITTMFELAEHQVKEKLPNDVFAELINKDSISYVMFCEIDTETHNYIKSVVETRHEERQKINDAIDATTDRNDRFRLMISLVDSKLSNRLYITPDDLPNKLKVLSYFYDKEQHTSTTIRNWLNVTFLSSLEQSIGLFAPDGNIDKDNINNILLTAKLL